MALAAGTLFAINGTVSKVILESGIPALRLTEVRCVGGFLGLLAIVLLTRPETLRIDRRELVLVAAFGVFGVALVQLFYFLAIHRLQIGVSLLIQYLGPLIVAVFAHFVFKEHVRRRLWMAIGLALVGLTLVVDLWGGVSLDGLGVLFSLLSALHVRRVHALRRARAQAPRPDLAPLLRVPVRERLLGPRPAVVELPVRRAGEIGLAARPPLRHAPAGLGPAGVDDRARDDRALHADRRLDAAHLARPAPGSWRWSSPSWRASSRMRG